jgi:hypothetical protein
MTWQQQRLRDTQKLERRIEALRAALRQPGAKLVLQHWDGGHAYRIVPAGNRVADWEAATLIRRQCVRPHDDGLFFGLAQTWVATDPHQQKETV